MPAPAAASERAGRRGLVTWDEHRNTSRVWPVSPDALPAALRALEQLRVDEPALCAWIEEGAPTLTDAEHVERFGEPFTARAGKRGRGGRA